MRSIKDVLDNSIFAGNFNVILEKDSDDSEFVIGKVAPKVKKELTRFGHAGVKSILDVLYYELIQETETGDNLFDVFWDVSLPDACLYFKIRK